MPVRTPSTTTRGSGTAPTRRKSTAKAAAKSAPPTPPGTAAARAPKTAAAAGGALSPATSDAAPSTDRARRGDLLDAMAERTTMRRAELKEVMDLMLEEIGRLVDAGDEVVLPPLGKLTVKKRVPRDGGAMLTVKLKRSAPESA